MSRDEKQPGLSREVSEGFGRAILNLPPKPSVEGEPKGGPQDGAGYKSPPKASQFRKGQSGNPAGRPKAAPPSPTVSPLQRAVLKTSAKNLTVKGREGPEDITLAEAVIQKTAETALKGNALAQKIFINELHRAEAAKAAGLKADIEYWTAYRQASWAMIDEAHRAGEEEPPMVPHPDDVVIDAVAGVSFTGPTTFREQIEHEITLEHIDAYLLQDALDKRLGRIPTYPETDDEFGYAFLTALSLNASLPVRLKSRDQLRERAQPFRNMTKRQLQKETRAAWAKLGLPRARGVVMPTWGEAKPYHNAFKRCFAGFDGEDPTEADIYQRLKAMFELLGVEVRE